ncbi:MAG: DUF2333 family protein [Alphaproteobacteria bacterium]
MALREIAGDLRARLPNFSGPNFGGDGTSEDRAGLIKKAIGAVLVLALIYYPAGFLLFHTIDDDLGFAENAKATEPGRSHAVAIVANVLEREVKGNGWVANDPWFYPTAFMDNMPNYQQGMIAAFGRFAYELQDQLGRSRGSSQVDPDLDTATGLLQYPADVWHFDIATSIAPTATSEAQYKRAIDTLRNYNERLGVGAAVYEKRADNLLATLDRIALDLGASSAVIDEHLENQPGFFVDTTADDVFYATKGQLYAYAMVLEGLGLDFESIIVEKDVMPLWREMTNNLKEAAELQPWIVVSGAPDSQFLPSHLAGQGFYLLRARTQLREITNILLK